MSKEELTNQFATELNKAPMPKHIERRLMTLFMAALDYKAPRKAKEAK